MSDVASGVSTASSFIGAGGPSDCLAVTSALRVAISAAGGGIGVLIKVSLGLRTAGVGGGGNGALRTERADVGIFGGIGGSDFPRIKRVLH
jgi:hypothetical protein